MGRFVIVSMAASVCLLAFAEAQDGKEALKEVRGGQAEDAPAIEVLATAVPAVTVTGTITRAGVRPDPPPGAIKYYIEMDCDDDARWKGTRRFYLSADLGEAGYATALTAVSLNRKVMAQLVSSAPSSLVRVLDLLPE